MITQGQAAENHRDEMARRLTVALPTTAEGLEALRSLHTGHFDDLVLDVPTGIRRHVKVWRSRVTTADGAPYEHGVTVEVHDHGSISEVEYGVQCRRSFCPCKVDGSIPPDELTPDPDHRREDVLTKLVH